MKAYYVYILTNKSNRVLYVGITSNISKRIYQHRNPTCESFTSRYNVTKLVHVETYEDPYLAIRKEKQLKAGSRKRKNEVVNKHNPDWKDLSESVKSYT